MTVQVFCVKCDRSCRVPPEYVGKRVRCPGCQEIFKAEQPPVADAASDDAIQVFCSKCDQAGRVLPGQLGRRVRCPRCQESFTAEDVPVAAPDEDLNASADTASAADSGKASADSTFRKTSVPPPPPLRASSPPKPRVEELELPEDRPARSRRDDVDDEDEDDDRRSRGRRERDEEEDDEDRRPRRREERDRDDDDRRGRRGSRDEKPRPKKEPAPGADRYENPFIDSSTLASVEADPSAFEFDFGDEPEPEHDRPRKKKVVEDKDRDEEDSRDKRSESRSRKGQPDTEYAWDEKKSPPDELPSDSGVTKKKKPSAPKEDESPFGFIEPGDSGSHRDQKKRMSEEKAAADSKRDHAKKPPKTVGAADDAAFFGLADQPEPAPSEKSIEKPGAGKRAFFHLRQTGYWDEPRLFRVFAENDELIFILAAAGDEIPEMEKALRAESLDEFEKSIRKKARNLNELSIDELLEADERSFVWSAGKIIEAYLEPANAKHGAAALKIEHKTKGSVSFDLPSNPDVQNAVDVLRHPLARILQVHIRWDKTSKRFVKR